jgi:hypothetical protein
VIEPVKDVFEKHRERAAIAVRILNFTSLLLIVVIAPRSSVPSGLRRVFWKCSLSGERSGGALLLIADHAPAGAAAILATRFGVDMSKEFTADPVNFAGSRSLTGTSFDICERASR